MLGGQLDDAPPALDAECAAARVLEGGDRIEEGRLLARAQRGLERVRVEPLVVAVQRDVGAELLEDLQRPVVGRALDEHALAGREPLREEDEALQGAVRDEDARGVDPVPLGEPLAQRRVAGRRAVREDRAGRRARARRVHSRRGPRRPGTPGPGCHARMRSSPCPQGNENAGSFRAPSWKRAPRRVSPTGRWRPPRRPVVRGRLRMKVVSLGRAQRRDAASSERAKSHRS